MILEKLEVEKWLELNAKLQQKKNALRKTLKEKGILKKGATNEFDKYSYFSEAQYKELFTELFSSHGLELKSSESDYNMFEGTEKQANGRNVKFEFNLYDIETGFFETSYVTGEGIDKGDKAGYKADTGALKYYLANTFMVATGDDPEKESPDNKMNDKTPKKATEKQIDMLEGLLGDEEIEKVLQHYKIKDLADLTIQQASSLISRKKGA
jgi:hypothetical protein